MIEAQLGQPVETPAVLPRILHAGCGKAKLPEQFGSCVETRLDIDRRCNPDVVAMVTDMGDIGPFDLAYSSHVIEHLYPHQVPVALAEFIRVLRPGGTFVCVVPDLEDVKATDDVLFHSESGAPICGLDLYYGWHKEIAENPFMTHKCGFIADTMRRVLEAAGFVDIEVRRLPFYQLWATARTKD